MSRVQQRDGFVLLEQILALMVFAIVGVALVTALNEVGRLASQARKEAVLSRLLDSELRAAMSMPTLEEFEETISLEEMKVDMTTIVTPKGPGEILIDNSVSPAADGQGSESAARDNAN